VSNEFFFDDEADEKKPVKKGSNKKGDSAKKPVAKKPDSKGSTSTKPGAGKNGAKEEGARSDIGATAPSQGVQPMLVVAIAVIALFVGVIGGIFIGKQITPKVTYTQADIAGTGSSTPSGMSAATGGAVSPSSSSSSTTK